MKEDVSARLVKNWWYRGHVGFGIDRLALVPMARNIHGVGLPVGRHDTDDPEGAQAAQRPP